MKTHTVVWCPGFCKKNVSDYVEQLFVDDLSVGICR